MSEVNRESRWQLEAAELASERDKARAAKDTAYAERNQCVAMMAKMALRLGWAAWLGHHDPTDTAWERDWLNIVFIELPTGQVSWHIHDSELPLFGWLPRGGAGWDGHNTEDKYERMRRWGDVAKDPP